MNVGGGSTACRLLTRTDTPIHAGEGEREGEREKNTQMQCVTFMATGK